MEGKGNRIYHGTDGETLVIRLSGGKKASEKTHIAKAKKYWENTIG